MYPVQGIGVSEPRVHIYGSMGTRGVARKTRLKQAELARAKARFQEARVKMERDTAAVYRRSVIDLLVSSVFSEEDRWHYSQRLAKALGNLAETKAVYEEVLQLASPKPRIMPAGLTVEEPIAYLEELPTAWTRFKNWMKGY